MKNPVSVLYMAFALLFSSCLIIANIVEQKLISIGPIEATAGLLIFPISYIVNDVIVEVWGFKKARLVIWGGFAMNFLAVLIFHLSIFVPGSVNFSPEHQSAFSLVLGNTLRISAASFVAFLCGSFVNAYVMSKMKIWSKGKGFSLRAVVSTLFGEGCDSVVFFSIAFSGVIPARDLVILIFTQMSMKTGYEILVLPLTNWVVKKVKEKEHTDTFDTNVSYNPLKISDL
ncbi:MAG: queuosine precursor transporter [Fibrobacter sp.]|jgi:uncharacterized integral membrane protein (TIGR00697 family)|nr:queuosine precursor transporter [Fibrobacter sp.]